MNKYPHLAILLGIIFLIATNALVLFGLTSMMKRTEKKNLEEMTARIGGQCQMIANQIQMNELSSYHFSEDSQEEQYSIQKVELAANNLRGRIMLVDKQYCILLDTYHLKDNKYLLTPRIVDVMKNKQSYVKKINDRNLEFLTVMTDQKTGEMQGVMVTMVSLLEYNNEMAYLESQKNILMGIFFIISLAVSLCIMKVVQNPFFKMQKELDSLVAGHHDNRLSNSFFYELTRIAKAVNALHEKYQKLEDSRQEFASNVSHELKTPITSMKILADSLIMQDNVPVEIYKEFMEDIVHEVDRESQIINDLLELVKMDKKQGDLSVAATNINELLEELLKRISPIAEKRRVTLRLETMRAVSAEVDRSKLSMALTNLIENAVKYNKDDGFVDVSLNADHKFFYIRIKDTGIGIPEDCRESIFGRFYRVDKARSRDTGGTGLGLAISRNIILLHKGNIKVHSKVGVGSTFIVRIPLNYV